MRKAILFSLLLTISITCFAQSRFPGSHSGATDIAVPTGVPKNIILILVDGMGVSELSAADIKAKKNLRFSEFPTCGFMKSWNAEGHVLGDAADYTAMATGQKTAKGNMGVDSNGNALKNLFEWAKSKRMLTGLVTTAPLTDPTNVALALHEMPKTNQDQQAADYLKTDLDLIIGGGYKNFQLRADKKNLIPEFMKKGYDVETKLKRVDNIHTPKTVALLKETEIYRAKARGNYLRDAAVSATRALTNGLGYLLIINNTKVRDAEQVNDLDFVSEEVQDVDVMIGKLLDYMKNDPETLIIVAGSSEVGGLVLEGVDPKKKDVKASWQSKTNTANVTPVFSNGPGSQNFTGIFDNTQIFTKITDLMNQRP